MKKVRGSDFTAKVFYDRREGTPFTQSKVQAEGPKGRDTVGGTGQLKNTNGPGWKAGLNGDFLVCLGGSQGTRAVLTKSGTVGNVVSGEKGVKKGGRNG